MALRDVMDGPLSLRHAARQAGCSKDTLWRAVRRGELNAAETMGPKGRQLVLDRKEFDKWVRRRMTAPHQTHAAHSPQSHPPHARHASYPTAASAVC